MSRTANDIFSSSHLLIDAFAVKKRGALMNFHELPEINELQNDFKAKVATHSQKAE